MEIYLVGGAVRDQLLGLQPKERDWVVTGATREQMLQDGYLQVGKDFPVFLHPETKDEYALARTERKQGHGYTGFEINADPSVSLEEDLLRRDLTVNAIAMDGDGRFIDPYNGREDLQKKVLRHVSAAFVEDPLRVLRVARFAARYAHLGFSVAEETMALMKEISQSGELSHLVAERVWTETCKALSEQTPSVFFTVLRQCGALEAVFPEIDRLFGVPQRKEFHPEVDTGIHTMLVVDRAAVLSDDLVVRFAALLHDLGKAETPEELLPRHHGHEKRGLKPIRNLCNRLRVPNNFRDMAIHVAQFHGNSLVALELKPNTLLEMFEAMDLFRRKERLEQFVLASQADYQGRPGYEQQAYPQADYMRAAFRACSDVDTKSLAQSGLTGAEIGIAIHRARAQAIAKVKLDWGLPEQQEQNGAE